MAAYMEIGDLINEIHRIRDEVLKADSEYDQISANIHPQYKYNAKNLLRYLKLRTFDLRKVQASLASLGVSSLSHSERHVLANLENILYLLNALENIPFRGKYAFGKHPVNFIESGKRLKKNTRRLFGKHVKSMGIMVTLSPEAVDKEYMQELLISGMNVARINSAHDDPETWQKMIDNLRECCDELGKKCSLYFDLAGPKIRVEECSAPEEAYKKKHPIVRKGSDVYLLPSLSNKRARSLKEKGKILITCSQPSIIADLQPGHRIWFDDGRVGGVIQENIKGEVLIRIDSTDTTGGKMRVRKGINLPDTNLDLPALSKEDIAHLDMIAREADMIGFSFVRRVEDIEMLQAELRKRHREKVGIVLKIENRQAFDNMPELVLQAMQWPTIGVMTARGDLAVELGSERLSEVQEEIMWLCEAAMIPNIWATQVLQSMVKKGNVSRAEITDAAMSVRVECVMLNKGKCVVKALNTLDNILSRMDRHVYKKFGILGSLQVAENFWQEHDSVSDSDKAPELNISED